MTQENSPLHGVSLLRPQFFANSSNMTTKFREKNFQDDLVIPEDAEEKFLDDMQFQDPEHYSAQTKVFPNAPVKKLHSKENTLESHSSKFFDSPSDETSSAVTQSTKSTPQENLENKSLENNIFSENLHKSDIIISPETKPAIKPKRFKSQLIPPVDNFPKFSSPESTIDGTKILEQLPSKLESRLIVDLPLQQFEINKYRINASLSSISNDIEKIDRKVSKTNDDIKELSKRFHTISEKSQRITQTADYISTRLNIISDWVDGLETSGSGIKMALIELGVKFLTFLSSLFLIVFNSIIKIGKSAFRRKSKDKQKQEERKEEKTEEEEKDEDEKEES